MIEHIVCIGVIIYAAIRVICVIINVFMLIRKYDYLIGKSIEIRSNIGTYRFQVQLVEFSKDGKRIVLHPYMGYPFEIQRKEADELVKKGECYGIDKIIHIIEADK